MNFGWSQVREARARIAPVLYSGFGPSYTPEADIRERPLRVSAPAHQLRSVSASMRLRESVFASCGFRTFEESELTIGF